MHKVSDSELLGVRPRQSTSDLSMQDGFGGFIVAEAMDQELFIYYISEFGALPLPPVNNPYRFMLFDAMTENIRGA